MEDMQKFIFGMLFESSKMLKGMQANAKKEHKSPRDLVTDADFTSQKFIANKIGGRFPSHRVYSEENLGSKKDLEAKDCWIIDPLDGTNNYAYGFPIWGVSIAYSKKGEVSAGGIAYPMHNIYLVAKKGEGALQITADGEGNILKGERLSVSKRKDISQAMLLVCYAQGEDIEDTYESLKRLSKNVFHIRNLGAAVFDIGFVSQGLADSCILFRLKPFDGAAASLLVREAGGKVTDVHGKEWELGSPSLVASNSQVHDGILRILKG